MPYRLVRHAMARRITLRVSGGDVRITLPRRAAVRDAVRLMEKNAAWVVDRLDAATLRLDEAAAELGLTPRVLLLRGRPVPVARLPANLEAYLRAEARRDLTEAVARRRDVATKRHKKITVRDQRSRWGSCSSSGTLSFNYRLVMAPPAVLDYLVVHELVHLDVPNHSKAYWRRVLAACPRTREHEAWLSRFGDVLMRPLPGM